MKELAEEKDKSRQNMLAASSAYSKDKKEKRRKFQEKIQELEKELETLSNISKNDAEAIAIATIEGDDKLWCDIQTKIRNRETEKAVIGAQIEALQNADVVIDVNLAKNLVLRAEEFETVAEKVQASRNEILQTIMEESEKWRKLNMKWSKLANRKYDAWDEATVKEAAALKPSVF